MARQPTHDLQDVAAIAERRGQGEALLARLPVAIAHTKLPASIVDTIATLVTSDGKPPRLVDLTHPGTQPVLQGIFASRDLRKLRDALITALPRIVKAIDKARREEAAAQDADGSALTTHMTTEALVAWAVEHGARDLIDLPLEEVADLRENYLRWYFADEPLRTILTTAADREFERWRDAAAVRCIEVLRERAAEAKATRELATKRHAQRTPPTNKKLLAFYKKLVKLRTKWRGIAPSPDELVIASEAHTLADPLGLVVTLSKVKREGCDPGPRVRFVLTDRGLLSAACSCEALSYRPTGFICRSRVDALERVLTLLASPATDVERSICDRLTADLSVPIATRQARRYLQALGLDGPEPLMLNNRPAIAVWRLHRDRHTWRLTPGLARRKKTGAGFIVRAWQEAAAAAHLERHGSPRDQAIARLARSTTELGKVSHGAMDRAHADLQTELLRLMVDHPHIYPAKGAAEPLQIGRSELQLQVNKATKKLEIRAIIDGDPATDVLAPDLIEALAHGDVLLWEADAPTLKVVHASASALGGLELELAGRHRFAASVLPEVRAKLLPLAQTGEVTFTQEVRGEEVLPAGEPVVELAFDGKALRVALRVEPLPGSALATPGDGPLVWYAMRGDEPVYCERNLAAEATVARDLWATLSDVTQDHDGAVDPLFQPSDELGREEGIWRDHVRDLDRALDLISWFRAAADAPTDGDAATRDRPEIPARWRGLQIRWDSEPVRLLVPASAGDVRIKVDAGRDWFGVQAGIEVGGSAIPLAQFLQAARDARRYVHVAGRGWLKVEAGLRRRLSVLADEKSELSMLAAPVLLALQDAGAEVDGPQKWLQMADRIRAAAVLQPTHPAGLRADLRPYQVEGFHWLSRLAMWAPGAVLADDMGLGKTVQALALLLRRQALGPAMVVAPTSLGFNWIREAAKFAPELEMRALRGKVDVAVLNDLRPGVVVVTSWDVAVLQQARLRDTTWATLVLDEAQAIKNPTTRRAKAIVSLDADFRVALSGTPMENHTGELWSIFRAAVPGLLGTQKRFRERFQVPIERHNDERAKAALAALIGPFLLRRLKSEVAKDLPERADILLDIELSTTERKRYEQLRKSVATELARPASPDERDQTRRFRVLAALTRLRQLACHPALVDPKYAGSSAKLEELRRRLDQLRSEGHRALVFSQFTSLLDLIRPVLEGDGVKTLQLDGRTPSRKRRALVEAFQAGEADAFLLSIKAGGTGLNLTAASYVFHLDPWWNPAVEDQATDRAHRIGQDQRVTVYRLVACETVEGAIYAMHDDKRALTDALLSGANKAGPMAIEELEALLMGGGRGPIQTR